MNMSGLVIVKIISLIFHQMTSSAVTSDESSSSPRMDSQTLPATRSSMLNIKAW